MFRRTTAPAVQHSYTGALKPGVRFVQTEIRGIDPQARRVETEAGTFEADVLVIALGADAHPSATPDWSRRSRVLHAPGCVRARDVLDRFEGGRVVVAVTSTPFKCPPAPSETAPLLHDFLDQRGLREKSEISLVMPLGAPIPPSPAASALLREAFVERDIAWHPERLVRSLDPGRRLAMMADGDEMPFDLFLGVARSPRAAGGPGLGDVRRRLDPGGPTDVGDVVPGCLCGRRRR